VARTALDGRTIPEPTPLTSPFFDAGLEGRFLIPTCPRGGPFFYPRARCPCCWRDDWRWIEGSGRGRVHTFTIDRLGHDPQQKSWAPYIIAIVTLDEGPRVVAQITDCTLEDVRVGMPVRAVFEVFQPEDATGPVATLRFEPDARASAPQPRSVRQTGVDD
jgi:uncharacterized OB-fold protein